MSNKSSTTSTATSASQRSKEFFKTDDMAKLHNFGESSSSSSDHTAPADILDFLIDDRPPEETRDMYNWWADAYNEDMNLRKYKGPQILAEYIYTTLRLPKTCNILDMGCGTGLSGIALHDELGYTNVDGVDLSEEMVKLAKKTSAYKNTFLEKITKSARLEYREVEYDCVLLCTALLPGHISPSALPNICRIVKPKQGYLVWVGPTLDSMGSKSTDFLENNFMRSLNACCDSAKMELIERKKIDEYREDCQGELFALRRK